MPNYKIPIVWMMAGTLSVEAESLEAAENRIFEDGSIGLPEGHYIEASVELDVDHSDYGQELPKGVVYA